MDSRPEKDFEQNLNHRNLTRNEWIQPQKQPESVIDGQGLRDLTLVRAQRRTQRMLGEESHVRAHSSSSQSQVRQVSTDAAQKFALHLHLKAVQIPRNGETEVSRE
jgi:hypothetical protein